MAQLSLEIMVLAEITWKATLFGNAGVMVTN